MLRLLSWNVAGRAGKAAPQVNAIAARKPDVVALQEVTESSKAPLMAGLSGIGLTHAVFSFDLAPDRSVLTGPRSLGLLLASRFPLHPLPPELFQVPWRERVLSAVVTWGGRELEIHTTHIPPGVSNKWIKIEMLEGLYRGLSERPRGPRILCGDFNTPQAETEDGQVMTWAYAMRGGKYVFRNWMNGGPGRRWHDGEYNVLKGLEQFGLGDVYRRIHGYRPIYPEATSWRERRYDHVLASTELEAVACSYMHEFRLEGLSDHSGVETDFARRVAGVVKDTLPQRGGPHPVPPTQLDTTDSFFAGHPCQGRHASHWKEPESVMATSNSERIRICLGLLTKGLRSYVETEMRAAYGDDWEREARAVLRPRHLLQDETPRWDAQAVLNLIDRKWEDVFRRKLDRKVRSWVVEVIGLRNEYAHGELETFSDEDTFRGLDTIERLLTSAAASEASEVRDIKLGIGKIEPPPPPPPPPPPDGDVWTVKNVRDLINMCLKELLLTRKVYDLVAAQGTLRKSQLSNKKEAQIALRLALLGYLQCDDYRKKADDRVFTMAPQKPEKNVLDL